MKKKNRSWRGSYFTAVMAHMASENSPKRSLAKKHTAKVALRYARQTQSIWRAERIWKVLLLSGAITLIAFVVMNWR